MIVVVSCKVEIPQNDLVLGVLDVLSRHCLTEAVFNHVLKSQFPGVSLACPWRVPGVSLACPWRVLQVLSVRTNDTDPIEFWLFYLLLSLVSVSKVQSSSTCTWVRAKRTSEKVCVTQLISLVLNVRISTKTQGKEPNWFDFHKSCYSDWPDFSHVIWLKKVLS